MFYVSLLTCHVLYSTNPDIPQSTIGYNNEMKLQQKCSIDFIAEKRDELKAKHEFHKHNKFITFDQIIENKIRYL